MALEASGGIRSEKAETRGGREGWSQNCLGLTEGLYGRTAGAAPLSVSVHEGGREVALPESPAPRTQLHWTENSAQGPTGVQSHTEIWTWDSHVWLTAHPAATNVARSGEMGQHVLQKRPAQKRTRNVVRNIFSMSSEHFRRRQEDAPTDSQKHAQGHTVLTSRLALWPKWRSPKCVLSPR